MRLLGIASSVLMLIWQLTFGDLAVAGDITLLKPIPLLQDSFTKWRRGSKPALWRAVF